MNEVNDFNKFFKSENEQQSPVSGHQSSHNPQNESAEMEGKRTYPTRRQAQMQQASKWNAPHPPQKQSYRRGSSKKKSKKAVKRLLTFVLICVVIFGGGLGATAMVFPGTRPIIASWFGVKDDYEGPGEEEILFTIKEGETGADVAENLAAVDIVKTDRAFYRLLLKQDPEVDLHPGIFRLETKMSAQQVLDALQDPDSRAASRVMFPEGYTQQQIFERISETTGIPEEDLQKEASNPQAFGLPEQAQDLEGFLFPATYNFPENTDAYDVLEIMVDRMFQALDEAKVPKDKIWDTIVLASIVEREAGRDEDFPKVARVFLNRLEQGWKLESDATVTYGTKNTHRAETLDSERADETNLHNTYVHYGLPIGPISNPGDRAIESVMNPADGSWMFFVTWNLETAETIFSTTLQEHEEGVKKWRQWMKEHPEYG